MIIALPVVLTAMTMMMITEHSNQADIQQRTTAKAKRTASTQVTSSAAIHRSTINRTTAAQEELVLMGVEVFAK